MIRGHQLPLLAVTVGVSLLLGPWGTSTSARAGTITGTVRDGITLAPLAGIDIDVFDDRFQLDGGVVAVTASDGSFTLDGLEGSFYVRADPTLAQGYADRFWPGGILPSQATLISVGRTETVSGIDFELESGVRIQGFVFTTDGGAPLVGCDIDVLAPDGSFLSGVDGVTGADGSYEIGLLPPGEYVVKADPTLAQGYVPEYYPDSFAFSGSQPISVGTTGPVVDISFGLGPGGEIAGRVVEIGTLAPAVGADIDLFDSLFQDLAAFDASVDELGDYSLGIVPVGTYYVKADALNDQPWVDMFYGQSETIASATPVTVAKGQLVGNVDIQVPRQGFLSGTVVDGATSQPIPGLDLDVLDTSGNLLPQYDGATLADGTYRIGPIPPGNYLLRADAGDTDPWVDQYQPGVFSIADATPITVGTDVVADLDFTLARGGWISGTMTRVSDGTVVPGVDLDVFLPDGTPIPSVDADTDAAGNYRLGSLPTGTYVVRGDPIVGSGLAVTYWAGTEQFAEATPVQVLVGLETSGIDIALGASAPTATPANPPGEWTVVTPPHPNPFSDRTSFRLRSGALRQPRLWIFDLRGRRVREFTLPRRSPGDELVLQWDGRDEQGRPLASGVYFLRLGDDSHADTIKLLHVR